MPKLIHTNGTLERLQEERKKHHRKKIKAMKVFLRKKQKAEVVVTGEVLEDPTPKIKNELDNIIFFDGHDPAEIRMLFTPGGRMKNIFTVKREPRLLPKIKLPNRPKPKRDYIRQGEQIEPYTPKPKQIFKSIVRVPVADPEPKPFTRPAARYDNRQREEIINQYLSQ